MAAKKVAKFEIKSTSGKTIPVFEETMTKGKGKGKRFLTIYGEQTQNRSDLLSNWPIGTNGTDDFLNNILNPAVRKFCIGISKEAQEASQGDLETEKSEFERLFNEASARAIGKRELQERIMDMINTLKTLEPGSAEHTECLAGIIRTNEAIAAKSSDDDEEESEDSEAVEDVAKAA